METDKLFLRKVLMMGLYIALIFSVIILIRHGNNKMLERNKGNAQMIKKEIPSSYNNTSATYTI